MILVPLPQGWVGRGRGSWDTHIPVVSNSLIYLVFGFLDLPRGPHSSFLLVEQVEAQEEEAAKKIQMRQRGGQKGSWVRVQM